MKYHTGRDYLLTDQYRDSGNVTRRFDLHEQCSVNRYGWHPWVFDQLEIPPEGRILELGSGPAYLWVKNADRIPAGWRLVLSDFSKGMIADARNSLSRAGCAFHFATVDAQSIPFQDSTFDAVIANHMLYHLPDLPAALAEVHRVLVPSGVLYATTNGKTHLQELGDLVRGYDPTYRPHSGAAHFGLEDGRDRLSAWFTDITLSRYDDALEITEAEVLRGWAMSWATSIYQGDRMEGLLTHLSRELESQGTIHVTKDSGLFTAQKGNGGRQ
ncbi:MAG: methyltransferase domain-containing protein [Candidatus Latescibacteria bacterium]|jgi:SAM-dependent methyltransferase|nr:methyltransferase domain-containing protein [Candidatus Latescibacterota bacterium]